MRLPLIKKVHFQKIVWHFHHFITKEKQDGSLLSSLLCTDTVVLALASLLAHVKGQTCCSLALATPFSQLDSRLREHAPASYARAQHLCIYAKQGPPYKCCRWLFFLWSKVKCSETLAVLLCFGIAPEAAAVVLCFVYLCFPFTTSWLPETLRRRDSITPP